MDGDTAKKPPTSYSSCNKKYVFGVLSLFCVSSVIWSMEYVLRHSAHLNMVISRAWTSSQNVTLLQQLQHTSAIDMDNGSTAVSTEQPVPLSMSKREFQRFLDIQRSYRDRLAGIPAHTYRPVKDFIEYGRPVNVPNDSTNVKTILMWTPFFGDTNFIPHNISCGENIQCVGTHDKSALSSSDAVVIHVRDFQNLPPQRAPFQRWVYLCFESPYHTFINLRRFEGVFNWTATYRQDADVFMPYFQVGRRTNALTMTQYRELYTNISATKSKLVAYMNSNCQTPHSNRLQFIRELQKHIPVDTYGHCGNLKCERNSEECTRRMSQYKFYLAMENSHCRDYITEKAGQPLFEWNAVPVVMGAADPSDYEKRLPPGSYIHTSGFESAKQLAEYLLMLDSNPTLYERYHQWRRTHDGGNHLRAGWCNTCRLLHNHSLPTQYYRDFSGWYNQDTCRT